MTQIFTGGGVNWGLWAIVFSADMTIISIEKERYSPSLMLAYRMAEVFGVTVEELCCLKENKELEDKLEELDERNRLIALKSKSKV